MLNFVTLFFISLFFFLYKLINYVYVFVSAILRSQDIAALIYLWNPFTIIACVDLSTSPIENVTVILSFYGVCTRKVPIVCVFMFQYHFSDRFLRFHSNFLCATIIFIGVTLDLFYKDS